MRKFNKELNGRKNLLQKFQMWNMRINDKKLCVVHWK
jgi:hypothetical protein